METIRPLNPYERDVEQAPPVARVGRPPEREPDERRRERRRRAPEPEPRALGEGSEHVDTTA
jgi:hypothetical protein